MLPRWALCLIIAVACFLVGWLAAPLLPGGAATFVQVVLYIAAGVLFVAGIILLILGVVGRRPVA